MDTPPSTPSATPPLTPPAPEPTPRRRPWRVWRLIVGGAIVLLGLQWLAANFGWSWTWSVDLWKFWPVVVILIGVSFMTRGRSVAGIMNALVVVTLVVLASSFFFSSSAGTHELRTTSLTVEKNAATTAAIIDMKLGAAKVRIDGGATSLTNGSFRSNIADMTIGNVMDGTTQQLTYSMSAISHWWFRNLTNDVVLSLNNDIPTTLSVDTGATDFQADLTNIQLTRASIQAGASSIALTLGDKLDNSRVDIDSGAASIDVYLPSTAGVSLSLDTGVSGKTLPKFSETSKGEYRSDNYDSASKHIELHIQAGASSITMHWK